ncbi:MAG: single-stranded DNA-binding protein [bacterium]|nr:single-stranded DNA-binding protein [bacterium]
MNNVTLVGRITRDPELRTIASGQTTTTINVAVNRPFTSANGEREADFINVVVWRKQAENVCKYCTKGSLVGVSGRIQTRSYDGQDGQKRYVTEVVADNVSFLGSKNATGTSNFNEVPNNNSVNPIETTDVTEDPFKDFGSEVILNDDDLPF